MAFKKAAEPTPEPVSIEETFSVTLDTGEKGEADTHDQAVWVGRELLTANPNASFFGIAKKYKRGS